MITLKNVSKYFVTTMGRRYVLRDANLAIGPKEKVGVVGRNGAGKSTLMRLFAGVDVPDEGTITRVGSISWPMGLATGLQPILTGRENARFACRIQGMSRRKTEVTLKFVRKFSEVGDYFEMPVRTYSSGMKARLNFSIAMAFDFDFYIIDELTAVGDRGFRKKSRDIFKEKRENCGFIKVSHNMGELSRECDTGLLLENGKLTYFPAIKDAIAAYKMTAEKTGQAGAGKRPGKKKAKKRKAAAKAKAAQKINSIAGNQPPLLSEGFQNLLLDAQATARAAPEGSPHRPAPMMPRLASKKD